MTQIVCHRGARLNAPENTHASARKALALGGSIIELDIRQSCDGILYVMHDETVDRTTNGSGKISDMHSRDIDRLDAGLWFSPAYAGERVPRLGDFLAEFAPHAGFYLEIKQADCKEVARVAQDLGIAERCFTFSFDPEMRDQMRIHAPFVRRMILWSIAGSTEAAVATHHAEIVEFHAHDFDPQNIRLCHDAGLQVMFYTDQNDLDRFKMALELSMDFVNIDHIEDFHRSQRSF